MWIALTLGFLLLIAFALLRPRRPQSPPDLGWVTQRWLIEHRGYQSGDSR
jgi:hypothetical protein